MSTTHSVFQNRRPLKQTGRLVVLLIAIALVMVNLTPRQVAARSSEAQSSNVLLTTSVPLLIGSSQVVNNGPGNQTDPHLDGNLVSYTDDNLAGTTSVRYFDFATNIDHLVPGNGADSESEVNVGRIAFTESTSSGSQVVLFDTATQTRIVVPAYGLSKPTIGGPYLLFEDRSSTEYMHPSDIGQYFIPNDLYFPQTSDYVPDTNPIISQAGNTMFYQSCQSAGVGCSFQGFLVVDPGTVIFFTIPECPGASQYDVSNDHVLAYTSNKDGDTDIYIQPILGQENPETRLLISGEQRDVSISGNLVAFESPVQLGNSVEYDIFVYDISTGNLYQATNTPVDESLSDISISHGFARIVYDAPSATTNSDVLAFKFRVPGSAPDQIVNLSTLVTSFNLSGGTANSLTTKLQDALAAIDASDTATACDSLTAFINACQAQSGKKLTVDQATQLISSATLIKTHLGC